MAIGNWSSATSPFITIWTCWTRSYITGKELVHIQLKHKLIFSYYCGRSLRYGGFFISSNAHDKSSICIASVFYAYSYLRVHAFSSQYHYTFLNVERPKCVSALPNIWVLLSHERVLYYFFCFMCVQYIGIISYCIYENQNGIFIFTEHLCDNNKLI